MNFYHTSSFYDFSVTIYSDTACFGIIVVIKKPTIFFLCPPSVVCLIRLDVFKVKWKVVSFCSSPSFYLTYHEIECVLWLHILYCLPHSNRLRQQHIKKIRQHKILCVLCNYVNVKSPVIHQPRWKWWCWTDTSPWYCCGIFLAS